MVVFMFAHLLCAGLASTVGHQGYVRESNVYTYKNKPNCLCGSIFSTRSSL